MFFSEQLLIRDGPLAHVWLAANLEKKLTKHQLLQTSIEDSTKAIAQSSTHNSHQAEPIALRLTGQLLFGIVRIYSRKAKYLLDDVSDALLRIKTAFRSNQSVVLPVEATTVQSVSNLTLPDTVTSMDLLYQEPLRFDEIDNEKTGKHLSLGGNSEFFSTAANVPLDADVSIEYPRAHHNDDYSSELMNEDVNLELDFDLGDEELNAGVMRADQSIEVGRNAGVNASFDNDMPDLEDSHFNLPELTFEEDFEQPVTPPEEPLPVQRVKRGPITYLKNDVVRTKKRKLIVDSIIEIPSEQIRVAQLELPGPVECGIVPSTQEKLDSVVRSSTSGSTQLKELRRIWDESSTTKRPRIDEDLREDLHQAEEFDMPDFSIPDLDFDIPEDHHDEQPEDVQSDLAEENDVISADTEFQTATHIRNLTENSAKTTFLSVLERDSESGEPLSSKPKAQAARAFFEVLVLATNDSIEVEQTESFGEIGISARARLLSSFV
ncbi:unnamed protein product [Kuraishia capsulata CBS 1993]|uniref:Rad21/Rec8-like protein N-terminal domain-containing protein n=1 Tax=Kuraishia capsulata CBS 1993 TaxID=1382522 RepID=W6MMB9_9ASCO|nr:uncharacterized protein KUCA_T00002013001 [Kuraishia capsulata CBS 1993]CDK26042.1 unnamed protein product [Kuraishia capsulata CBS 1993]